MKKIRRITLGFLIAFAIMLSLSSLVFAIVNPDSIDIGSYKVFENVLETGDMLFIAEGQVTYAIEPTDYTADEAFIFQVLNTAGNVTLVSTTLQAYGDRPISIYQTSDQVASVGLVSGTAYKIRIMGNPAIFPSQVGNSVNKTLDAADYIDYSITANTTIPNVNDMRNFCIEIAVNMEAVDTPIDSYLVTIDGFRYLTDAGGTLFIEGIPGINNFCSILFQTSTRDLESDTPTATGAYTTNLTAARKWGDTVADGLTNIGVYLGLSPELGASAVLFGLALMLAVYTYQKTQSGLATLVLFATTPFAGAFMGLMPLALAFIFTLFIVIILGYFFFSRGAL